MESSGRGLSSHAVNRSKTVQTALLLAMLALLILPLPFRGRLASAVFDAAHLIVGWLLAAIASNILHDRGWLHGWQRELAALVLATVAGAGIEVAQGVVGRDRSWMDAATNGLGACAWFLMMRARAASGRGPRATAIALCVLVLLIGLVIPGREAFDALRQRATFPLLASFEDELELTRVTALEAEAHIASLGTTDGTRALAVDLHAGQYPGVTLKWLPEDWSGHDGLAFDITLVGDTPLELVLKVEDQHHDKAHYDYADRFHRTFTLNPGANSFRVALEDIAAGPSRRPMNLARMARIQWFLDGLDEPRRVYLDNVRLTTSRR